MKLNLELKSNDSILLSQKDILYKLEKEILTFSIENIKHTINLKTKEFTRENDEYAFFLNIAEEKCEITMKKEQYHLQVLVEYANLLKNKNIIHLSYFIETDDQVKELILELEGEEQ